MTQGEVHLGVVGPLIATRAAESGEIEQLALGGPKQLSVLSVLIARRPEVVTPDALAHAVYGDDAPERGRRRVQTYVSTLRSVLGDVIVKSGEGWYLDPNACVVDVDEFERRGRAAKDRPADEASSALADALALWRGEPYSGVETHGRLDGEITRLEALRVQLLDSRIECDLATGRAGELVGELSALVAEHPYNERFRAHHMLALYRSGRQEEALRSFQDARRRLVEQLGVEPGPELSELEGRMLRQDASLLELVAPNEIPLRGYRLLDAVRRTEHSTVWRAAQPSIKRDVTIRHIKRELSATSEYIRNFEARAQSAARVDHPNVVTLIDYWRDPDGAYLVTGWHSGRTLASALEEEVSLDESQLIQLINQVGTALAAAHRASFGHGQLDASSVLLDGTGNAFLDLFGGEPDRGGIEPRFDAAAERTDVEALARLARQCLARGESSADTPRATDRGSGASTHLMEAIDDTLAGSSGEIETVEDFLLTFTQTGPVGAADTIDLRDQTNPYKGLQAFHETDADDFFGRTALVETMLGRLGGNDASSRLLTVVGPSGSGKSSLVRAGLIPALREGGVPGSEDWFITTMTPGSRPFEALDEALRQIASTQVPFSSVRASLSDLVGEIGEGRDVLVVIDQFEELFTHARTEDADRFLTELSNAARTQSSNLRVVATLRADHYGDPLSHADFAPIFTASTFDVTPLGPDELVEVVTKPAERRGLQFDSGLVARIAADSTRQGSPLPLLQYTLAEIVERRDGTRLTKAAYDEVGGVSGAIKARAEQLYNEADDSQQAAIRRVFTKLASTDMSVVDLRRRAMLADFTDDAIARDVMSRYGAARLLSFGRDAASREPTVEVAHEALLREWPRVAHWLHEDRELITSVDRLATAADAWHEGGRGDSDLYRGARLDAAHRIRAEAPERLRATDRAFLDASNDLAEQSGNEERRRVQRLRRLLAAAVVGLLLAVVGGLIARSQQQQASARATEATARGLAATANVVAEEQLDLALLLAANAAGADQAPATVGGLINVLEQASGLESFSTPAQNADEELFVFGAISVAADPVADTVRLFDTDTGETIGALIDVGSELAPIYKVDVSDDGSTLLIGTRTELSIWNTADGTLIADGLPLRTPNPPFLRLSPLGTYLVATHPTFQDVEVYRTADGALLGRVPSQFGRFFPPTFSPLEDRLILVTTNTGNWLSMFTLPELEAMGPQVPIDFPGDLARMSPNESLIAFATEWPEAEVTLLDAATNEPVSPTLSLEGDRLADVRWNPDSTRVAMVSVGGEVLVIDAQSRTIETRLTGHAGFTPTIAFLDRSRLAVMVDDSLVIWDLDRGPTLSAAFGGADVRAVDVRPDGAVLTLFASELEVALPGEAVRRIPLGESASGCGSVFATPFVGHALITCGLGDNASALAVDLESGTILKENFELTGGTSGHNGYIRDAAVSPDSRRVVIGGWGRGSSYLGTSDLATGEVLTFTLGLDEWIIGAVEWTPDGDEILAGGQFGDLLFVDPDTLTAEHSVPTSAQAAITDISFDADGNVAVVANEHGEVWLIDLKRREAIGEPFTGSASQFQGGAMSPDGTRIAAIGRDGDLRIWDAETRTLVTAPLSAPRVDGAKVRFATNDELITFGDGPALVWDLGVERLRGLACELAGRRLTDDERAIYADGLTQPGACIP